jgi:hypothetical protein
VIRFEDDRDGLPQIVLTKGQRELIDAGMAVGIEHFQLRATDTMTRITFGTRVIGPSRTVVEADWWPTGRFRSCTGTGPLGISSSQSLSQAIADLEGLLVYEKRQAKKKSRAKVKA